MFKKKDFFYVVVICYIFLLLLLFMAERKQTPTYRCHYGSFCVRTCCATHMNCNHEFVKKNLEIPRIYNQNLEKEEEAELKVMYGEPICPLEPGPLEWNFTTVCEKTDGNLTMSINLS